MGHIKLTALVDTSPRISETGLNSDVIIEQEQEKKIKDQNRTKRGRKK